MPHLFRRLRVWNDFEPVRRVFLVAVGGMEAIRTPFSALCWITALIFRLVCRGYHSLNRLENMAKSSSLSVFVALS